MRRDIKGLVLLGGYSTRMKQDKGLLEWQGKPLFCQAVKALSQVCCKVYVSLRKEQIESIRPYMDGDFELMIDRKPFTDIGPASGILTAHEHDPQSGWFVFACDFPLASIEAFEQLIGVYQPPFVTFVHDDGHPEPVFGIWSPQALSSLKENALEKGKTGPCYTLNKLIEELALNEAQCLVKPGSDSWLFNTNTPEDWQLAMQKVDSRS